VMPWFFSLLMGLALLLFPQQAQWLMYAWAIDSVSLSHADDASMLANFARNRATFERLRTMVVADHGLERVDDTWCRPADPASIGLTGARIEEYRRLCRDVGCPRGVQCYNPERRTIEFIASTRGLHVSGSSKGYVWLATPPAPGDLVPDLDPIVAVQRKHVLLYRRVADHWYLYYDTM